MSWFLFFVRDAGQESLGAMGETADALVPSNYRLLQSISAHQSIKRAQLHHPCCLVGSPNARPVFPIAKDGGEVDGDFCRCR